MRFILKYIVISLVVIGVPASPLVAQPTVTNYAEVLQSGRSILITFVQPDIASMVGCHYNIFAAGRESFLNELPGNGVSIATFTKNLEFVQIIARPLRMLRRSRSGRLSGRTARIFLRTLISCPDAVDGLGTLFSVRVPTHRTGQLTMVKRLILAMKYHMQYY